MAKVTPEHIEARVESIKEAAMRVFVEKGVENATMQEIASEAGLSAGAIYRYYASKEDLLQAVWDYCMGESRRLFEGAGALPESPIERIVALGRMVWDQMREPDARARTILQLEATLAAARNPQVLGAARRQMRLELLRWMEEMIDEAKVAHELRDDIDTRALAIVLVGTVTALNIYGLELQAEDLDPEPVREILGEMLSRLAPAGR
jgi:AcrR family transcriptional regulator